VTETRAKASSADRELDLVVIGDVNPDILVTGAEPRFGQREVLVDAIELTIGGSAGIMATAAARLGLRVAIVGVVGDDVFGRFMLEALRQSGVDVDACGVDLAHPTGATVILARPTDRAILTAEGTIAGLTGDDVPSSLLARTRHVHVASYFLQPALRAALPSIADRAHAAGATISVDPNWDPAETWDGGLTSLLPTIDLFFPNEEEAVRISRTSTASAAAHALHGEANGPIVAVKRGARGALAVDTDGTESEVAAVEVEPVDTTGAGDAFDAAFLAAWLAGRPLSEGLIDATAAGTLSTRGLGGVAALPTRAEVDAFVSKGRPAR
jgi:sugar/nucleoside kinase (ribokinase family)